MVGGVFHLNLDSTGDNLIFCAFKDYGWDIFRMNYPFEEEKKELTLTGYRKKKMSMPFDITETTMKKERLRRLSEEENPEAEKEEISIVKGDDEITRRSDYAN
ncbi:MAG: hypothetical protein K9N05_08485, partial [Candidatus Marinimicrobia bacterium]|nr:hypothetical protein [Candidatus Neomarinimicrobiota bacterium]